MNIQFTEIVRVLREANPDWPPDEPLYVCTSKEPTKEEIDRVSAEHGSYVAETTVFDCADGTDLVVDFDHSGNILGIEVLWACVPALKNL
jgi:uncharacterized protein YuzE